MKGPIKGLFVIVAIVMSFFLIQGVWAVAEIEPLVGTATTVANRAIGIDTDGNAETTEVTVYHMGPPSYWEDKGISYPWIGAALIIEAYDSLNNGYVGVRVCYQGEYGPCIQLRDPYTLEPLWDQIAETTDLPGCPDGDDCEPVEQD